MAAITFPAFSFSFAVHVSQLFLTARIRTPVIQYITCIIKYKPLIKLRKTSSLKLIPNRPKDHYHGIILHVCDTIETR